MAEEEITLNFSYNQEKESIHCHKKDKIKNMFEVFCKIKQIDLNSVYFLCGGDQIKNQEQTFEQLGKKTNVFSFIVVPLPKKVWIIFSHSKDVDKEEKDGEDRFDDIFSDYARKKKININKLMFKYKGNEIDLTKTKTINEFLKSNIDELYSNKKPETSYEEMNETTEEMNETMKEKKNEKENENASETIYSMKIDKDPKIPIDVIDVPFWPTFYKNHKSLIITLITILTIIIIAGITTLIVLLLKGGSNKGSDSFSLYPIPDDYFLKATYISEAGENVRLISDIYNLNKIKKMTIDGKTVKATKNYTFNHDGEHIIYFSFNNFTFDSYISQGGWIFSGIENLKYVEFSDYTKVYPDVSFEGMFNNCKNLESVDLSQIKIYYADFQNNFVQKNDKYYYYINGYFDYLNSMEYMFNNCTSLKSLNFDFKINDNSNDCIKIKRQKFMFNNCISLTYISISSLCFY